MRNFFISFLTLGFVAAASCFFGSHEAHADTGICWDVRCNCHRPCEGSSGGGGGGSDSGWTPPYPGWPFFPPPDPYAEQKRLANEYAAKCVKLPPKQAWTYCQSALNTCVQTDANCDIHRWNLEMGGYQWFMEDKNYPSARNYLERARKYCKAAGKCVDLDKWVAGTYRMEQNRYCVQNLKYSYAQYTCTDAVASCYKAYGKKHPECKADEWNLARNKMFSAEADKKYADAAAAARNSRKYCGGPRLACADVDREIAQYDSLAQNQSCIGEPNDESGVAICKSALANCRIGWTEPGACDRVERNLMIEQCLVYAPSRASKSCDAALSMCKAKSSSCNLEKSLAFGNRGEMAAKEGDLIGAVTEFRRGVDACKAGNLDCGPMLDRLTELEKRLERFDRVRGEWAPGDSLESAASDCRQGFDTAGEVCGPSSGEVPSIGDEVEVASGSDDRDRRAYEAALEAERAADARIDDYERQQLEVIDAFLAGEIKSEDEALKKLGALDKKIASEEKKRGAASAKKEKAGERFAAKKANEPKAEEKPADDPDAESGEDDEIVYELR